MQNDISDEVLVSKAKCGDKASMEELLRRYSGYVKGKARCFFLVGSETEDLVQEGMIGLCEAIMDFSHDKGVPFNSFAKLCVYRQIISAIKSANRQKQKPLNEYISLSSYVDSESEDICIDVVDDKINSNPEDVMLSKELINLLKSKIETCLTANEKQIMSLYLGGHSYGEISEKINKSTKSIDNALYRIRKKLKNNLNVEK